MWFAATDFRTLKRGASSKASHKMQTAIYTWIFRHCRQGGRQSDFLSWPRDQFYEGDLC
jgi:hypothetical protein